MKEQPSELVLFQLVDCGIDNGRTKEQIVEDFKRVGITASREHIEKEYNTAMSLRCESGSRG